MSAYDDLIAHTRRALAAKQPAPVTPAPATGFSDALLASVSLPRLRAAANGDTFRLPYAFNWSLSPQGHDHWRAIYKQASDYMSGLGGDGPSLFTTADREWLADLLKAAEAQP